MNDQAPAPLPKALKPYISHKRVMAAKIEAFTATTITLAGGEVIQPDPRIFDREVPTPGWWFMLYADGYQSLSPPQAFEQGYKPEAEAAATVDMELRLLMDSAIAKARLEQPSRELSIAITHLETANLWLNARAKPNPSKAKEH